MKFGGSQHLNLGKLDFPENLASVKPSIKNSQVVPQFWVIRIPKLEKIVDLVKPRHVFTGMVFFGLRGKNY